MEVRVCTVRVQAMLTCGPEPHPQAPPSPPAARDPTGLTCLLGLCLLGCSQPSLSSPSRTATAASPHCAWVSQMALGAVAGSPTQLRPHAGFVHTLRAMLTSGDSSCLGYSFLKLQSPTTVRARAVQVRWISRRNYPVLYLTWALTPRWVSS